jgi:hypothetical protein
MPAKFVERLRINESFAAGFPGALRTRDCRYYVGRGNREHLDESFVEPELASIGQRVRQDVAEATVLGV